MQFTSECSHGNIKMARAGGGIHPRRGSNESGVLHALHSDCSAHVDFSLHSSAGKYKILCTALFLLIFKLTPQRQAHQQINSIPQLRGVMWFSTFVTAALATLAVATPATLQPRQSTYSDYLFVYVRSLLLIPCRILTDSLSSLAKAPPTESKSTSPCLTTTTPAPGLASAQEAPP